MKKFVILIVLVAAILGCAMLTSCGSNETKVSSEFPGFYCVDVSSRCVYACIKMGSGSSSSYIHIEMRAEDGTLLRYEGELPSTSSQFVKVDAEELGLLPANIVRVDG